MEQYLYSKNFIKHYFDNNIHYYLKYIDDNNNNIIYLQNYGYNLYFKKNFNLEITSQPNEAFLIIKDNKYYVKILEHKYLDRYSNKNSLKTGITNIQLYDMELNNENTKFKIELSYSINNYVNNKLNSDNLEYINIKKILDKVNIYIFNNENDDYYDDIFNWITNIE